MTIDQLVKEAHNTALDKGWWIFPRTDLEIHALIHSEIAEATEAVREKGDYAHQEELADAVIRIADFFGKKEWDLSAILAMKMAYNKTRPFRHGNKCA